MIASRVVRATLACVLATGCASAAQYNDTPYVAATTVDPTATLRGVSGIGMESQDFIAMSDRMVRDLLANKELAGAETPTRIIIDDTRFLNESSQTLNLALIVDRLRIELLRSSNGRMRFVSRQNADLVEKEKVLKATGRVDTGGTSANRAIAGADYLLIGKIASQSTVNNKSGARSNYFQFSFEMLDLNNGTTVWGNLYDVKKAGADASIYR